MQQSGGLDLDQLVEQLDQVPMRVYSYATLAALFGPLALRLLGLGPLGNLLRPAAMVFVLGGIYAKRQKLSARIQEKLNI